MNIFCLFCGIIRTFFRALPITYIIGNCARRMRMRNTPGPDSVYCRTGGRHLPRPAETVRAPQALRRALRRAPARAFFRERRGRSFFTLFSPPRNTPPGRACEKVRPFQFTISENTVYAPEPPESGPDCTLSAPAPPRDYPPCEAYESDPCAALADPFDEQGRFVFDDYADARDWLNEIFGRDTSPDPETGPPDETERIEAAPETVRPDTPARWNVWAMRADFSRISARKQAAARIVLLYLCGCLRWDPSKAGYGQCFPAVRTVAKDTGLSAPAVKRTLDALRAAELIRFRGERWPDGTQRNNRYTLRPAFGAETEPVPLFKESTGIGPVPLPKESTGTGPVPLPKESTGTKHRNKRSKTNQPAHGRADFFGSDSLPASERPANGAKAAGADQRETVAAARDWLKKHGVRAVSLASVAETDSTRWRRIRAHVDGAGGQCGPGLIVKMLRGEAEPDAPAAYRTAHLCRACGSTYCRNVDSSAPPCPAAPAP